MERAGAKLMTMIGMAYVLISGIDDLMRIFGPMIKGLTTGGG